MLILAAYIWENKRLFGCKMSKLIMFISLFKNRQKWNSTRPAGRIREMDPGRVRQAAVQRTDDHRCTGHLVAARWKRRFRLFDRLPKPVDRNAWH